MLFAGLFGRWMAIVGITRFRFLAPLATFALLHPAPGGITPQEASAQLKAATADALKQFKSEVQLAKNLFQIDLQLYEATLEGGGSLTDATDDFFVSLGELQAKVLFAAGGAMGVIRTAAKQALSDLAAGSPLQGEFPKDFYWGAGGTLDKSKAEIKKQLDQLYKSLAGRFKKTAKVLEKRGATWSLDLRAPAYTIDAFFDESVSTANVSVFSMDILLALNRSEFLEDGVLWIGGTSFYSLLGIDVSVAGAGDETETITVFPTQATGRWAAKLDDGGTRFKKGNYIVFANADDETFGAGSVVSFR